MDFISVGLGKDEPIMKDVWGRDRFKWKSSGIISAYFINCF